MVLHIPNAPSASTPITTPSNAITTDDIEAAITELSPHSPQGTDRSTLSSVINSLTSSNAASVLSLIEVDRPRPILLRALTSKVLDERNDLCY